MATFLSNSRMDPALRARIQTSLRARSRHARLAPTAIAVLRVAAIGAIVVCVLWFVAQRQADRDALAAAKADVKAMLARHREKLPERGAKLVEVAQAHLLEAAGAYAGDFVAEDLDSVAALDELLKQPLVYVRGDLSTFESGQALGANIARSSPDSLVYCLLRPPEAKDEKALLKPVYASLAKPPPPVLEGVARLYSAVAGLPVLEPAWTERIDAAEDRFTFRTVERLARAAPLDEALHAASAKTLLFVMDEPKHGDGPSELDGSNRHYVRVQLVDLESNSTQLRLRLLADPEWISDSKRVRYARPLLGCRVAFDLREAVSKGTAE